MRKIFIIGLLIIVCISIGSFVSSGRFDNNLENYKSNLITNNQQFSKIKIGEMILKVEVVRDQTSLSKGLSGRDEIGSDGMLFIFPSEQKAAFWMKEMKFDLDMIWIKDNKVVEITENVPKPENDNAKLVLYSPQQPITEVLEVKAGDSSRLGIKVGDETTLIE